MLTLTLQEKIEIIEISRRNSTRETANIFNRRHQHRFPITHSTVSKIQAKLRRDGYLERKKRTADGNWMDALKNNVVNTIEANPNESTRRIGAQLGVSHVSVWRVLRGMKFHPYKMSLHQKLFDGDQARRVAFCRQLRDIFNDVPDFHKCILWSDEKPFRLNDWFNRQNFRHWARNNPHWVGGLKEVHKKYVMAWAGILDNQIIGPYFFERNVTGDSYLEMITDYLLPELHRRRINPHDICYMHDGAPAHRTAAVRQCLTDNFFGWIGPGDGSFLAWPPRSPELNPLDFYLWGVLQHEVNKIPAENVQEIQNKVAVEIGRITAQTLEKVHENLKKRLQKCIEQNGELFEHLLN